MPTIALIGGCENYRSESIVPTLAEVKAQQPFCGLCVAICPDRRKSDSNGRSLYKPPQIGTLSEIASSKSNPPLFRRRGSSTDSDSDR